MAINQNKNLFSSFRNHHLKKKKNRQKMSFAPKKSFSLSPFSSSPLPLFLVSSAPFFSGRM